MTTLREMRGIVPAAVGLFVLISSIAAAQSPAGPTSVLEWDQPDTDASTLTYWVSVDGGAVTQVQAVLCAPGVLPAHLCSGDLPPLMTGLHGLTIFARRTTDDVDFDTLPSTLLSIVFSALPSVPQNLRLRQLE